MMTSDVTDILTHRLKKLSQSELPTDEISARIQKILEGERGQKLGSHQPQHDLTVPLFAGRRAHLNVV